MNTWKAAFSGLLFVATAPCLCATSTPDYWWRPLEGNRGLNDALEAYGLSPKQLDQHAEDSQIRSSDVGSPLYWIARSTHIYGQATSGRYYIPIAEEHTSGKNRTASAGRMADFYTQTWADPTDVISITLRDTPPGGAKCTAQTSPNFGEMKGAVELVPGKTITYKAPTAGTITLGCRNTDPSYPGFGSDAAIDIAGGKLYPMFVFGVTPFAEWKEKLSKSPNPAGKVHMFGGRTRFDLPAAKAAAAADMDLGRFFREHLDMTLVYDSVNGLDGTGGPLNYPSQGSINATYAACCVGGDQGTVKIGTPGTPQNRTSWTEWEIYGYQYQMDWDWWALLHVSDKLYAISACKPLRGTPSVRDCQSDESFAKLSWDPDAVGTFLHSKEQKHFDDPDDGSYLAKSVLFADLTFTYPDMFARLGRQFRKQWDYGNGSGQFTTQQQKKDWFVVNTSRYAKRDLTGFYRQWGLYFTPKAAEEIRALGLPEPVIPISRHSARLVSEHHDESLSERINHPDATNVGLIAYSASQGPVELIPDGTINGYATLRVPVHDSALHRETLVLRGLTANGTCPWRALNVATPCDSANFSFWKLEYHAQDNISLPSGRYKGEIDLAIRSNASHLATWGQVLHVDVDVQK